MSKLPKTNKFSGMWMLAVSVTVFLAASVSGQTPDNTAKAKQAEAIFTEARTLANQGTPESMKASIPKFEAARNLLLEIGDKDYEGFCLLWLGLVHSALGETQKSLGYYNQALPLLRDAGNKQGEATILGSIAEVYNNLGDNQKALDYYNQALLLIKTLGDKSGEAMLLNNLGKVSADSGDKQKALDFYNQSLPLRREIGDKRGESTTLSNIGAVYSELGENQKALDFYNQALPLKQAIGDKRGEAITLNNIGAVYAELGEKQKALDYYNQSLPLSRAIGDRDQAARTLGNIGKVYSDLGENQKALDYLNQALTLIRAAGDKRGEATALNNIGSIYNDLGDSQKALNYYNQALPLIRAVGDTSGEARILSNIGQVYKDLSERQKALDYYNQSLPLLRAVGDKRGEATTFNNIGAVYSDLGEYQKALDYYNQSLLLRTAIGDKGGQASTLNNIGLVYSDLSEKRKALNYYNQALPLMRAVGDKSGEAATLNNMMFVWQDLGNRKFAAFNGKQSVNLYQELRSKIASLDKEIQKTYLKSIEDTYRRLADILIADGRIPEAEQVLAMLKEEEFFAYTRRDDKVAGDLKAKLTLSAAETEAFANYEKLADKITSIGIEDGALQAESKNFEPGKFPKQARLDELDKQLADASKVFNAFLDSLKVKFGANDKRIAAVDSDTNALLKELNEPHTVVISTIVGEDRLNLIVTTADTQRAHTVEIKAADLNKLVLDFRDAVKNPNVDPRPMGKKLFDVLFPAGLQKDLDGIKTDTIVWSLDGTLRYAPIAALWDGRQYLAERYAMAVITLASRDKLNAPAANRANWQALGVGVSQEIALKNADGTTSDFPALSSVPQELCNVISDPKNSARCANTKGVLAGRSLLDDEFTLPAFKQNLGRYSIVHIASHFSLNAGNESDSYLLLGGGDERRLTLAAVREGGAKFVGVELLTLSACNTAMSAGDNSSGVEIEGFGALAQKQGAKTVLATLWSVADDSTRDLMTKFYSELETDSKIGKAEALRNAQLALLNGTLKSNLTQTRRSDLAGAGDSNTANLPPFTKDASKPFAHPFYWSPFVLIGNWR